MCCTTTKAVERPAGGGADRNQGRAAPQRRGRCLASSDCGTTRQRGRPGCGANDENQSKFLDLVNAVIAILKQAAELDVTSANVEQKLAAANASNAPAALRQLFSLNPNANANANLSSIGITPERITEIILAVGNIDQIVERSIVNPNQNTLTRSAQMQRPL